MKPGPTVSPGPALTTEPTTEATNRAPRFPQSGTEAPVGTYRWDGFNPAFEVDVPAGWIVGHRHDEYVDLFLGQLSSVGFGRYDTVHSSSAVRTPITSASATIAALRTNADMVIADIGPALVAGLEGLTIEVRPTAAHTAIFDGASGTFNLDPGFVARYHLLDLPGGGVMVVAYVTQEADLDMLLAAAKPIVDSLRLLP